MQLGSFWYFVGGGGGRHHSQISVVIFEPRDFYVKAAVKNSPQKIP